jgi:hypothetical protein
LRERAFSARKFQLGAENNIEKSRCLAHLRKKIFFDDALRPGFSGSRAAEGLGLASQ